MDRLAVEVVPARRLRAAALIAAAAAVLGGAGLAYVWPVLVARPPTSPPDLVQVVAADFDSPASGWIVEKDSTVPAGPTGIYRTADAGRSWHALPLPIARSYATLLEFFGPGQGVLLLIRDEAAGRPRLFATDDGGDGWRPLALPVELHAAGGVAWFADPDTGWFLLPGSGGEARLWRTADGAQTWQPLPLPPTLGGRAALQFIDRQTGVLAAGELWVTHDGGASWEALLDSVPIASAIGGAVRAGRQVRIPISWPGGGAVLATDDGGATWRRIDLPAAGAQPVVALATLDDWYLAAGARVWTTHDAGLTWSAQPAAVPAGVTLGALSLFKAAGAGASGWSVGARGMEASTLLRTGDSGRHWTAVPLPRVD